MTAPAHLRPSYIVRDLRGLQEAQPSTDASDGNVWTCADATARLEDGSLTVSDATDINALRAACAAAWTYADNGGASVRSHCRNSHCDHRRPPQGRRRFP